MKLVESEIQDQGDMQGKNNACGKTTRQLLVVLGVSRKFSAQYSVVSAHITGNQHSCL